MEEPGSDKNALLTQESDEQFKTNQMAMRNGLEIFGKDGEVAMKCEMQQLHDRNVVVPVKNKELTNEQKGH